MNKFEVKKRIEILKHEINHHRYMYHVLDKQEISEAALDSLKHELDNLEKQYPDLITPDSPTQRIAGKPLDKFEKVTHSYRMLSLTDCFSWQELEDWEKRLNKMAPIDNLDYYAELKMDGLAISLIYKKGLLIQAATRGDGKIGEDVTQNIKTIKSIPLKLRKPFPEEIEVRGEVYMTRKNFEILNKREKGKYANPRNVAAGTIRQLDSQVVAERNLDFMAYDIATDLKVKTHEEIHCKLKELGFRSNELNQYCKNLIEVKKYYEKISVLRDKLDYWFDGLVVNVNNNRLYNKLGVVGKAPRAAIAYKFPAEQATTLIQDIQVQVGRTGVLTPVAHLKPVQVAGTTVSRATLHNEDEINRLDIRIGDTVIIEKAGDIIPDIIEVLKKLRPAKAVKYKFPSKCPVCNSIVFRRQGEAAYVCANKKCFAQEKERLHHFVSKKAFNIDGLGPKIIDQLLEENLIATPADIFELKQGDLEPLERFAEKAAENLIAAIDNSKKITLARFIYALGIKHIGEETAIDLADHFGSLEKLRKARLDELISIHEVGESMAESLYNYWQEDSSNEIVNKIISLGVKIINPKLKVVNNKIKDKIFVLTGSLEFMTRDEAKERIREAGGKISSSVSKNVNVVIAGLSAGSKLEKAKKLNVKILNEKQFLDLLNI